MKVLIMFTKNSFAVIDTVEEALSNYDLEIFRYQVDDQWENKLFDKLQSATHFLLVIDKDTVKTNWFSFSVGYCLGSEENLYFFLDGEVVIPDFLKSISIISDIENLKSEFGKEKIVWESEQKVETSKRKLIEAGFALSEEAFCSCVIEGEIKAVQLFLQAGFSADINNKKGVPVLCLAIRNNHRSIVNLLLSTKLNINAISQDRGNTPLMDAAALGNNDIVKDLIDAGADLNEKSKNGQTALILAVGQGTINVAETLIEEGAAVDVKDQLGMSALKYAKLFNQDKIIKSIENKQSI